MTEVTLPRHLRNLTFGMLGNNSTARRVGFRSFLRWAWPQRWLPCGVIRHSDWTLPFIEFFWWNIVIFPIVIPIPNDIPIPSGVINMAGWKIPMFNGGLELGKSQIFIVPFPARHVWLTEGKFVNYWKVSARYVDWTWHSSWCLHGIFLYLLCRWWTGGAVCNLWISFI